jgi:hypothetical protein
MSVLSYIYKFLQEFMCVNVLILYTVRKFYVAEPSWMLGMLQYGIRALVFNTGPGWAEQVEMK